MGSHAATWGSLSWGGTLRGATTGHHDDEDHDERDHDDRATDPDADAHPLLPQLGGAPLGGAALVLGPALGLRLASDWSLGRQRSEPVPAKGINSLQWPCPFGGRPAATGPERGGGLPQVAVDEGHRDGAVVLDASVNCQAPATPVVVHQCLAVDARARPPRGPRWRGGTARPRGTRRRGARPTGRPRRRVPTAARAGPRRSGPRRTAAWPGRRTRAARPRRGGGRASCSGTARGAGPSPPRPPGSAGSAPSAGRTRCRRW